MASTAAATPSAAAAAASDAAEVQAAAPVAPVAGSGNPGLDVGLNGEVVLVTGSTAGIGKAIARAFLQVGATTVINGRSQAKVDATIAELSAEAGSVGKAVGAVGDLSTMAGVEAVIKAVDAVGTLRVLVNNMGIFESRKFEEIDDERWMHFFNVNVMSIVRLCRHYLPVMLAANDGGRIINIGSEAGFRGIPDMTHYCTTKSAVAGLTRCMAENTKGKRVTVNSVSAGPTWTEGVDAWVSSNAAAAGQTQDEAVAEFFSTREPTSLIQRFLKPEEIAQSVVFLASKNAAGINGSALRCEGGIIRCI